jgi:Tfp pilus assembly protein PilE
MVARGCMSRRLTTCGEQMGCESGRVGSSHQGPRTAEHVCGRLIYDSRRGHGLSGSAILASPRAPGAANADRCRTLVARNSGNRFNAAQVREGGGDSHSRGKTSIIGCA